MRESTERNMHATVRACKRYIESHLCEEVTPQKLAEIYNCSYGSLRRYFREIGGYSVRQYTNLRRVHMVARRLREGSNVEDVLDGSGFGSRSGCADAFTAYYGITPWKFAKSRGMELMPEPEIMERSDFTIVGYLFPTERLNDWENNGAYWILQKFPEVSEREWNRIGGGAEMIGTWTEIDGKFYYIFGPGLERVQYIPVPLGKMAVAGGLFAVFPSEKPKNSNDTTVICENMQVTWYYALNQWLPDSDYYLDKTRIAYEYYLNGNNLACVPIIPKIQPPKEGDTT